MENSILFNCLIVSEENVVYVATLYNLSSLDSNDVIDNTLPSVIGDGYTILYPTFSDFHKITKDKGDAINILISITFDSDGVAIENIIGVNVEYFKEDAKFVETIGIYPKCLDDLVTQYDRIGGDHVKIARTHYGYAASFCCISTKR